jgi:outer membrane protein assembly factor BamB
MTNTVRIPPELSATIDLKDEFSVTFSIRSAGGSTSATLEFRDNDTLLGRWESAAVADWQTAGPYPLGPGRHTLTWSASEGGSFELKALAIGSQQISADELLAGQAAPAPAVAPRTAAGVNDQIEYFTSFDEHSAVYYFLSLIPWIYRPTFVLGAIVEQSDVQALSGTYSAKLYEDMLSTSYVQTKSLAIPAGANQVMVTVWCWPSAPTAVNYNLFLDDASVRTGTWSFSNDDVGNWVARSAVVNVGSAASFYCWYQLKPWAPSITANIVYTDNFTVDFQMTLPTYVDKLIDTDMNGTVYAVSQASGAEVWTFQCSYGFVTSAPIVNNGLAFFADGGTGTQSNMYALNADTGVSNWTMPMTGSCTTTPQFDSVGAYVATSAGLLYGFATLTGAQLFTPINFMNLASGTYAAVNGLVLVDEVAYISTADGIYAVNVSTQAVLWSYPTLEIPWEVAVSNGSVYAGCVNGSLYCINASTGLPNEAFGTSGKVNTAGPINCSPQVVGGVVIVGCDAGVLYGLNALTGVQIWTLSYSGSMVRSFILYGQRLYVIASATSAYCYAYDVVFSTSQWEFTKAWQFGFSTGADMPPVPEGGTVYFTANNKNLYALAATGGLQQWVYTTGRIGFTPPAVVYFDPVTTLNRGYDQYCYLTTHNAYASTAEGWMYSQQTNNIASQLADGVRGLMLDIWTQVINGTTTIVFCHGSCSISSFIGPFWAWPLLSDTLTQIKTFLDNNPTEVITIFFEQRLGGNASLLMPAFTAAGLQNYLFLAQNTSQGTGPNGQPVNWDVATQGWPSLSWMGSNNKRLVLFSDWGTENPNGGNQDGCPWVWAYAVENQYGNASLGGGCLARGGSQPLSSTAQTLFIMNYFPTVDPSVDDITEINDFNRVMPKCTTCTALANRLPNYIAVDFYQYGYNGGPRMVVAQTNAAWAQVSP